MLFERSGTSTSIKEDDEVTVIHVAAQNNEPIGSSDTARTETESNRGGAIYYLKKHPKTKIIIIAFAVISIVPAIFGFLSVFVTKKQN